MEINITNAVETRTLKVKETNTSGRIYLPRSWTGKTVQVVLLEEGAENGNRKKTV